MAGYCEENQNAVNGYEEEEEEEVEEVEEEVEEVEEEEEEEVEEGDEGTDVAAVTEEGLGGVGGGEGAGNGEAGGAEGGRGTGVEGGDASGKIFVGGVAWETTEELFTKHFEKYGAITDSVIMKDKHTRMPRGFGFVTFSDPSVIDRVLQDEHTLDGRTVEVKRTVPREEMSSKDGPKTRKIFVGGITPSLTEDKLKEHFSSYGKVVEHQIMLDHGTGRSRGFGFVTFESEEAVERVMSEGKMHDLGGKQVEIKKAEPKKPSGGDSISNVRHSHRSGGSYRSSYRGGGGSGGSNSVSGSGYGYGADYRSAAAAYYGSTGYAGYGRSYGYGGNAAFGSGFGSGSGYGGSMYGGPYGAYGAYGGAYGSGAYGAPGGYGAGGYGAYGGAGESDDNPIPYPRFLLRESFNVTTFTFTSPNQCYQNFFWCFALHHVHQQAEWIIIYLSTRPSATAFFEEMESASASASYISYLRQIAASVSPESCDAAVGGGGGGDDECRDEGAAFWLKMVAIAAILVSGAAGVVIPFVGRKRQGGSGGASSGGMFMLAKAFAAGVILATGFVHMLHDAEHALSNPCLPATPWRRFPFAGFVAMLAALGTLVVDFVGTNFYERKHRQEADAAAAVIGTEEAPLLDDGSFSGTMATSVGDGEGRDGGGERQDAMHIVGMHAHAAAHRHSHAHGHDACDGGAVHDGHAHVHGHGHEEGPSARHVVVSQVHTAPVPICHNDTII
ncbi:hypothetical protein GUJ93_ZPchr0006g41408 [Zizania palustris]|uniref:RRM domain-containing protein n=1 Tax=Zizania palustris TaxID=103762 RepID=A0A8J5T066_ZIZPA|nr:hypothetical protein GUJ93_ZPchr0006g41408 [Zizania palustris]